MAAALAVGVAAAASDRQADNCEEDGLPWPGRSYGATRWPQLGCPDVVLTNVEDTNGVFTTNGLLMDDSTTTGGGEAPSLLGQLQSSFDTVTC